MNEEIVELYKKRKSENKEEFISKLVLDGKIDNMIDYYEKKILKSERREKFLGYLRKIKYMWKNK